MSQQPWIHAIDDQSHVVGLPHGKMEALQRLQKDQWIFVPVVRSKTRAGMLIEHGFEIHRRDDGWEVVTAALEVEGNKPARVHEEAVRNSAVQAELEKLRILVNAPQAH